MLMPLKGGITPSPCNVPRAYLVVFLLERSWIDLVVVLALSWGATGVPMKSVGSKAPEP